jgi:hypothetical protein
MAGKSKKTKRGSTGKNKESDAAAAATKAERQLKKAWRKKTVDTQLYELHRAALETNALLARTLTTLEGSTRGRAIEVVLTVEPKGLTVSEISIDNTAATITVSFVDNHGGSTTAPADLAAPVFTSDNPSVATVSADPYNPLVGKITPVAVGSANLGIDPLLDHSGGVVPLPTPAPTSITVVAGAAASVVLTITP